MGSFKRLGPNCAMKYSTLPCLSVYVFIHREAIGFV